MKRQHDMLPEEQELEQRQVEIASLEAALSEKELELATRAETIQRFHTRYLQMVGTLYAELDEIEAEVARLEVDASPHNKQAQAAAAAASERAAQSAWESSTAPEDAAAAEPFSPTEELKNLYRAAARRLHPDRGTSDTDRSLRNDLMAQVNVAYRAGDQARIEAIIAEYRDHPEAIEGDDVGARLIRAIRQKSRLAARLREVEEELLQLENGELASLQREAEARAEQGEDALAELAAQLSDRIAVARKTLEEKRQMGLANADGAAASIVGVAKQAVTSNPERHTVDEALVFFDFETTGLKPAGCRVIEVGAVKVVNGVVVETFTSLIDPGVQLSSEITNITGITNAMLKGQSRPAEVMPKLHSFMRGAAIVAHNAKFDQGFLKMEFDRLGLSVPPKLLCTMKLAKRVEPGLRSYSLAALTSHFSLNANSNAHRALPDAHQTVALWQALEKQLLKQAELQHIPVALMLKLQAVAVSDVKRFLREWG